MRFGPALQLILALTLSGTTTCADNARAVFLGSFRWDLPAAWFGGFSGIELSDDGNKMVAITDRATIVHARIIRDRDQVTAIQPERRTHLRAQNGSPLIGRTVDSEGLATAPDGAIFISFERIHRVSRYDGPASPARGLHRPAGFRALPWNGGFEALAIDPVGRLIALPEDVVDDDGRTPVYRWENAAWSQPMALPGGGGFLPVAADFGPDGRLYVLERDFNVLGFRSRVRSWRLTETAALDERRELETGTGTHDNLEGLSVWRDTDGRLRLTMISDDNFFFLQKTELIEYALPK